jgi:hypothetical protein
MRQRTSIDGRKPTSDGRAAPMADLIYGLLYPRPAALPDVSDPLAHSLSHALAAADHLAERDLPAHRLADIERPPFSR